jgi:hypothetical protein
VAVKKVLGEGGTLLTSCAVIACYRDYNQVRQCCFIADAHARCAASPDARWNDTTLLAYTQLCSHTHNFTGRILLIANRLKELRLEGYDADYLVTLGTHLRSSHCTHYSHAVAVVLHCNAQCSISAARGSVLLLSIKFNKLIQLRFGCSVYCVRMLIS